MKYFTRSEAENTIPKLEEILKAADEIRHKAQAKTELIISRERSGGAIDVSAMAIEKAQIEFLAQCFQETLREIENIGALLKGLDPGLIDFPCRWDGHEIYLCWREGEKRIDHYHSIEEGFAGRKPLPRTLA